MRNETRTRSATDDANWASSHRPLLKQEVERCEVGDTTVLTTDGSLHLAFDTSEAAILDEFDGTRTCKQLTELHGAEVIDLVNDLSAAGFLVGTRPIEAQSIVLSREGIEFSGFDRLVGALDRAVGTHLSRRGTLVAGAVTASAGLAALFRLPAETTTFSATSTMAVLVVWTIVSALPHECAHALVLHRGGRRVGRAGFGMHWGAVAFFVDATDALFLPRRTRLAQTLAGPYSDAVIGGGLGLAAWMIGPGPLATLLAQMAIMNWIGVLINLSPLLELDGQHALEDLLDETDLHAASLEAIRRAHRATDRRTRLLATYGLIAVGVGLAALAASVLFWVAYYVPLLAQSWSEGLLGRLTALMFVGPTAAALAAWLANHAIQLRRRQRRRSREATHPPQSHPAVDRVRDFGF